jgi:transcription antitermination factor NusG
VIASLPQAERRAHQHLQEQGYQTYLPLRTVRRRDRVLRTLFHPVEVPLFTGYLFTRFDALRDPWRPILSTLGVFALIRRPDGMPNPVAEADFQAVQAVEALRRSITPPGAYWAPGMPCSPVAGTPFAGHPAVIIEIHGSRAMIALMLFGQLTRVSIDVACLREHHRNPRITRHDRLDALRPTDARLDRCRVSQGAGMRQYGCPF